MYGDITQLPLPSYHLVATPGGSFRQHVIGPDGALHELLTIVAAGLSEREPATATKYLRVILRFVAWCDRVAPGGYPPEELPKLVVAFLREPLDCQLRLLGNEFWHVTPTRHASSTIRLVLSALLAFVDIQIAYGLIELSRNPLRQPSDGRRRNGVGRFVVKGQPRTPRYHHEPDLPQLMLSGGEVDRWPQWMQTACAVDFDSGARTFEILDLRFGDWLVSGCGTILSAPSKGSAGRRVKKLVISPETAAKLHAYFEGERARRTGVRLAQLRDLARVNRAALAAPLFVNRFGDAPRPGGYGEYWHKTATRLGLQHTPHSARHWYVTSRVADILERFDSPIRRAQEIALLVEYMHWANGKEMLDVYANPLALRAAQDFAAATGRRQLSFDLFNDAWDVVRHHRDLRPLVRDQAS
jgi:integrase